MHALQLLVDHVIFEQENGGAGDIGMWGEEEGEDEEDDDFDPDIDEVGVDKSLSIHGKALGIEVSCMCVYYHALNKRVFFFWEMMLIVRYTTD